MSTYKVIGILGGMGPAATADLYLKIVQTYQLKYGANADSDFPRIVIESLPIPDILDTSQNETEIRRILIEASVRLEKAGCQSIVIACNSVQFLVDDLRASINTSILSMCDVLYEYLQTSSIRKLGLLCTRTTRERGVYASLDKKGFTLLYPPERDERLIYQTIESVLAGNTDVTQGSILLAIALCLKKRGAEAIALACTELPLVVDSRDMPRFIDLTQLYANAIVADSVI